METTQQYCSWQAMLQCCSWQTMLLMTNNVAHDKQCCSRQTMLLMANNVAHGKQCFSRQTMLLMANNVAHGKPVKSKNIDAWDRACYTFWNNIFKTVNLYWLFTFAQPAFDKCILTSKRVHYVKVKIISFSILTSFSVKKTG